MANYLEQMNSAQLEHYMGSLPTVKLVSGGTVDWSTLPGGMPSMPSGSGLAHFLSFVEDYPDNDATLIQTEMGRK